MADRESLADKAVSMLSIINEVEVLLYGINDIGEYTGFCDEHSNIVNDAHDNLGMIRKRAYSLRKRINRTNDHNKVKE